MHAAGPTSIRCCDRLPMLRLVSWGFRDRAPRPSGLGSPVHASSPWRVFASWCSSGFVCVCILEPRVRLFSPVLSALGNGCVPPPSDPQPLTPPSLLPERLPGMTSRRLWAAPARTACRQEEGVQAGAPGGQRLASWPSRGAISADCAIAEVFAEPTEADSEPAKIRRESLRLGKSATRGSPGDPCGWGPEPLNALNHFVLLMRRYVSSRAQSFAVHIMHLALAVPDSSWPQSLLW